MADILLIDLSSIVYPTWHVVTNDPNPNATSEQAVARVRALASGQPHVAICIDSRTSHRKALEPTYKAQRESNAPLQHQMRLAIETLKTDGFPVWGADGFEADDVIASAAHVALTKAGAVAVATADKDLLQLVQATEFGSVSVKSLKDSSWIDRDAVKAKLGVWPEQVLDYLCLVGDASDNVKGCPGIGPKWAAKILADYKSLDNLWAAFDKGATPDITANFRTKLQEFRANVWPTTKALITLRTDVPIAFEEIFAPRVPKDEDVAVFSADDIQWGDVPDDADTSPSLGPYGGNMLNRPTKEEVAEVREAAASLFPPAAPQLTGISIADAKAEIDAAMPKTPPELVNTVNAKIQFVPASEQVQAQIDKRSAVASYKVHEPSNALVPVDYERQLEPRTLVQAYELADSMFKSRLFSAYGTSHAVLSTILAGREFGMAAMSSLRAFHIIDGKPVLASDTIRALVLKSGAAEYFRCTERTNERATFVTKRRGEPEMSLTYTVEEAKAGWTKGEDGWKKSGWGKNPADMCVARAGAKLARLVYPDVVHGVYGREEFE